MPVSVPSGLLSHIMDILVCIIFYTLTLQKKRLLYLFVHHCYVYKMTLQLSSKNEKFPKQAGKRKWEEQPQSNGKTRAGHRLFLINPLIWPSDHSFYGGKWVFSHDCFCDCSKIVFSFVLRVAYKYLLQNANLYQKILPQKKCCNYYHIFVFFLAIIVLMFIWL